ncbi:hypothetical protein N7488_002526 [Penicillium malachiteum]|nr:hypothetical protein N7488_002526 [Penicillium malachiteum]
MEEPQLGRPTVPSTEAEEESESTLMMASPGEKANRVSPSIRPRVWWSMLFLPLSIIAPVCVLIWWIVNTAEDRPAMLSARTIGGKLTYIQAKAIDFVSGSTLAPLLMIILDYLWFSNARVAVVNERPNSKAVSLASLVAVSQSSAGSSNIFRIRTLIQGKTWRLFMLSLLMVLSGLAALMLQNFIAYEACNIDVLASQPINLRSLSNYKMYSFDFNSDAESMNGNSLMNSLQSSGKSDLANQISALLTGLNYEDAVSKLDNGVYIGTNATSASLNALNASIIALKDVPGYRLSIDCQPGSPTILGVAQMGGVFYQFTFIFDCPTTSKASFSFGAEYFALIPGMKSSITDEPDNNEYECIGFIVNNTYAKLGYLDSFNDTKTVLPSEYGDVHGQAYNMTPSGFTDTKSLMTNWGISCAIYRQEGLHNYTRHVNTTNWEITSSSYSEEKTIVSSFLSAWQTTLNYQAPISSIAGIGPAIGATAGSAFAGTANWTIYALNYLYASGETERISYEVAVNTSIADDGFFYSVEATQSVQRYRITYIPLLLLLGLLGVIGAASIASSLMVFGRDTVSGRLGREVNGVRLVVDCVAGLRDSFSIDTASKIASVNKLDEWATDYKVKYSEVVEQDGNVDIGLFQSGSEDAGEGRGVLA